MTPSLRIANNYRQQGFSVIPILADGTKKPVTSWKTYQSRLPTDAELGAWFGRGQRVGFGIVHGAVSQNSEVMDFDAPEKWDEFAAICTDHGLSALLASLPLVETPSGGKHLYYRSATVDGNQKLASRAVSVDSMGRSDEEMRTAGCRRRNDGTWFRIETLIETRGEGGYTVAPGSPAACHPDKREYRLVHGKLTDIPVISGEQRNGLLAMARALSEYVEPQQVHSPPRPNYQTSNAAGKRPGDDYNERADVLSLLERRGARVERQRPDGVTELQRPGKQGRGISGTFGVGGTRLVYIFSSSWYPFEPNKAYTPFAVYALLECDGDYEEAARRLADEGYGDQVRGQEHRTQGGARITVGSPEQSHAGRTTRTQSVEQREGASLTTAPPKQRPMPAPLHQDAFYGIAGRVCSTIEPHTEADIAAVLLNLLTMFGNVVGRTAFCRVEETQHFPNLFTCIVGSSSSGRKGTSLGYVQGLLAEVEPEWKQDRIKSGLSSGEGFIYAVRDDRPIGDDDKRLLVLESELANLLRVMEREGNTISAKIRDAWDSGNLSTLTRKDPLKATEAHVSILAHITPEELTRLLRATETVNGFANRFLFVYVRRSKLLPDGGNFTAELRAPLVAELREAVAFVRSVSVAQRAREVTRDPEAGQIWHGVYEQLTAEVAGLLGSVTSRAAPQVLRLSLIYALLDQSTIIRPEHLRAALAVWRYCQDSAAFIFGDAMGDPLADEILAALTTAGDAGLTRTDLRDLFSRNKSRGSIDAALETLQKAGRAVRTRVETDGRPAELWHAVSPTPPTTETTNTTKALETTGDTTESTPSVVSVVSVVPDGSAQEWEEFTL